jgi:hypothetical protein
MTSRVLDHVNVSNAITDVILVSTIMSTLEFVHENVILTTTQTQGITDVLLLVISTAMQATTKERNNDNIVVIMDTNQHANYHVACFLFYCYFKDTMLRVQNVATKSHEASLEMAMRLM